MLNISDPCIRADEELPSHQNTRTKLSQYRGKLVYLAFIDIAKGWEWLENLIRIERELTDKHAISRDVLQIIAVLFNYGDQWEEKIDRTIYSGGVTTAWIEAKTGSLNVGYLPFPLIANGPWYGSIASDYEFGFSRDADPLFNGNTGGKMFSYLLTADQRIADKWSLNCTNNNDPISFNRIILKQDHAVITGISEIDGTYSCLPNSPESAPAAFFSELFYSTKAFVIERIKNLIAEPNILLVNPPIGSGINKIDTLTIQFSKPIVEQAANNHENFTISGGSVGTLQMVSASYAGRDKIENCLTLGLTGSAIGNVYDDSIIITVNRAQIVDTAGNRMLPDANVIRYTADIVNPSVTMLPDYSNLLLSTDKNKRINSVIIKFSKPVLNALNPHYYTFSIEGIRVFHVIALADNEYMLNIAIDESAPVKNGDMVTLTLHSEMIQDKSGNPLANNALTFRIYDGCPSIVMDPNAGNYILGPGFEDGKNYAIIEFSEPVKGAEDIAHYSFSDESISIIDIKPMEGAKYRLVIQVQDQLSLLSADTVALHINREAVTNSIGNSLQNNSIEFTIDFTPPQVSGNNLVLGTKTRSGINTSIITFSKPVRGADNPAHYAFSVNYITVTKVTAISEREYELTIYIADNAPLSNGQTIEMIPDFHHITDDIGNHLDEGALTYSILTRQPSLSPASAGSGLALGRYSKKRRFYYRIVFTEQVFGAEKSANYSFQVQGFRVIDIVRFDEITYELAIQIEEDAAANHGDEILLVLNPDGITNAIGNTLHNNIVRFIIDTDQPTFTTVPPRTAAINSLKELVIHFSKPVLGAEKWLENYTMQGYTGSLAVDPHAAHTYDAARKTAYITCTGGFDEGIEHEFIDIVLSNITDEAGNELADPTITYRIDTVRPAVLIPGDHVLGTKTAYHTSSFPMQFSKPMIGADNPANYTFSITGISVIGIQTLEPQLYELCIRVDETAPVVDGDRVVLSINQQRVTDEIGNRLVDHTVTFIIDDRAPTVRSFPQPDSVINSLSSIEIRYSKEVLGADIWDNYSLESNLHTIRLDSPDTHLFDAAQHLVVLRCVGHIEEGLEHEQITLTIRSVTDRAGNLLEDQSISFQVDSKRPSVIVNQELALAAHALGGTTIRMIHFTKPVVGADIISHYSFSKDGIAVTGITALSPTNYQLTINIAQPSYFTDGDSALLLLDSNRITDPIGNRLNENKLTCRIFTTQPEVSAYPKSGTRLNALSEIRLTFSKDVFNVENTANYILQGPVGSCIIEPHPAKPYTTDDKTITLRVDGAMPEGIDNMPIQLYIGGITDFAGNLLKENIITYTLDTNRPSIISAPVVIAGLYAADGVHTYALAFSKPVLGAEVTEHYRFTHGSASVRTIKRISAHEFELTIGIDPDGGLMHGEKVRLIAAADRITDDVGNYLAQDTVTFVIDAVPPSFDAWPSTGDAVNALEEIIIEFSKEVTGADRWEHYTIAESNKRFTIDPAPVHRYDASTRRAYLRVIGQCDADIDHEEVRICMAGIADTAGNMLKDNTIIYYLDTRRPGIVKTGERFIPLRTEYGYTTAMITFTKPVIGADDPSCYSINADGLRITETAMINEKQIALTVKISEQKNLKHHDVITLTINNHAIKDRAGNRLKDSTVLFTVDAIPPSILTHPPRGSRINGLDQLKIVFSKPVIGADQWGDRYALEVPDGIGTLAVDKTADHTYDEKTRTAIIACSGSINPGIENTNVKLMIKGITDIAGNYIADSTVVFTIDTVRPTVRCILGKTLNADQYSDFIRIEFSKEVKWAHDTASYVFSTKGFQVSEVTPLDGNQYDLAIAISDDAPVSDGDTISLIIEDNITDLAYNPIDNKVIELGIVKQKSHEVILVIDSAGMDTQMPLAVHPETGERLFDDLAAAPECIQSMINGFFSIWKETLVTDDRIGIIMVDGSEQSGSRDISGDMFMYVSDLFDYTGSSLLKKSIRCEDAASALALAGQLLAVPGNNAHKAIYLVTGSSTDRYALPDNKIGQIPIYIIRIGDYIPQPAALEMERQASGRDCLETMTPWPILTGFLCRNLARLRNRQGLRLVHQMSGVFTDTTVRVSDSWHTSGATRSMLFFLEWLGKEPLTCRLRKGSKTLALINRPADGARCSLIRIDMTNNRNINYIPLSQRSAVKKRKKMLQSLQGKPSSREIAESRNFSAIDYDDPIDHDLPFSIEIDRKDDSTGTIPYYCLVLAIDEPIDHAIDSFKPVYFTGDSICFHAGIVIDGHGMDTGYTADATIKQPRHSLETLLAGFQLNDKDSKAADTLKNKFATCSHNEKQHALNSRYQILLADPNMDQQVRRSQSTSLHLDPLRGSTKGKKEPLGLASPMYTLMTPGRYLIEYAIKGYSEDYGAFERSDYAVLHVQARVDKEATQLRGVLTTANRRITITVIPKDAYGNHLGPGLAHNFTVKLCGREREQVAIIDEGNGNYRLESTVTKREEIKTRKTIITFDGIVLYNGITAKAIQDISTGARTAASKNKEGGTSAAMQSIAKTDNRKQQKHQTGRAARKTAAKRKKPSPGST